MTILLSLKAMEIYHQLIPLEIITLMEINNSNQVMIKSSYWGITHTFSRHFGRTKTPSASCLIFLDCCQKQSFCLFLCQTNWIKQPKLGRTEATTPVTPEPQPPVWDQRGQTHSSGPLLTSALAHILFASMALPVQTMLVGLDPLQYLSRKAETTQKF